MLSTLLVPACLVAGLLVGSFLTVVVDRVPSGESVVAPRSACRACGHVVRARDNVPVLSWLVLRGRCRDCGTRIGGWSVGVELATAGLFALAAVRLGATFELPAFLYLAAVAVALTVVDVRHHRLPDALVLPSYLVGGVLLSAAAVGAGHPGWMVRAVIGLAGLYLAYLSLVLVHPAGMGFGDVKLAGVLGLYLGYLGWAELLVGAAAAFVVGGLVGLLLMALGRAGRRTALPFGPFMLVGALLGVVLGDDVAAWYLAAAGL